MPVNLKTQAEWLAHLFQRDAFITFQEIPGEDPVWRCRIPDHNGNPAWKPGEQVSETIGPDDCWWMKQPDE